MVTVVSVFSLLLFHSFSQVHSCGRRFPDFYKLGCIWWQRSHFSGIPGDGRVCWDAVSKNTQRTVVLTTQLLSADPVCRGFIERHEQETIDASPGTKQPMKRLNPVKTVFMMIVQQGASEWGETETAYRMTTAVILGIKLAATTPKIKILQDWKSLPCWVNSIIEFPTPFHSVW